MDERVPRAAVLLVKLGAVMCAVATAVWFVIAAMSPGSATGFPLESRLALWMFAVGMTSVFVGFRIGFRAVPRDTVGERASVVRSVTVRDLRIVGQGRKSLYYVDIEFEDGALQSFRTVPEVFDDLSIGDTGTATLLGQWLGKIEPNRPSS